MRESKTATKKPSDWFAPDIDDNRETRELEVRIRQMSAGLYDDCRAAALGPEMSFGAFAAELRDRIVRECVLEGDVRGYASTDVDTGERRLAKSGADLVEMVRACDDPEELKILDQVAAAARDKSKLSEGLRSESPKPPEPSPPSPTSSANGAAPGADAPSNGVPAAPKPSGERIATATS